MAATAETSAFVTRSLFSLWILPLLHRHAHKASKLIIFLPLIYNEMHLKWYFLWCAANRNVIHMKTSCVTSHYSTGRGRWGTGPWENIYSSGVSAWVNADTWTFTSVGFRISMCYTWHTELTPSQSETNKKKTTELWFNMGKNKKDNAVLSYEKDAWRKVVDNFPAGSEGGIYFDTTDTQHWGRISC